MHRALSPRALVALVLVLTTGCPKPEFDNVRPGELAGGNPEAISVPEPSRDLLELVVATPVVGPVVSVPEYAGDSALMYAIPPLVTAGDAQLDLPPLRVDGEVGDLLAGLAGIAATARSSGSNGSLTGYAHQRLPFLLLGAGIQRFIGPDVLRSISVEKRAEREGTITWRGNLAHMALVEPVTLADRIVSVQFLEVTKQERSYDLHYRLTPDQLDGYRAAYPAFSKELDDAILAAESARADFESRFRAAKERYENDGGRYEGKEPSSGDEALARHTADLRKIDARVAELHLLEERYPPPEKLESSVEARVDKVQSVSWKVVVEARVVEAKTQRTLWVAELGCEDLTPEAALERVLQRLVDSLASPLG
jgi:hypothetical protein